MHQQEFRWLNPLNHSQTTQDQQQKVHAIFTRELGVGEQEIRNKLLILQTTGTIPTFLQLNSTTWSRLNTQKHAIFIK